MKKLIIGSCIILGLTIGGCTKKIEKPIMFDQYRITLSTQYSYQEVTNSIPGSPAIKQYIQEVQTGFIGSIVIAKNELQTGINITTFANNNSKSLTRKITGANTSSTSKFSFTCGSGKIQGILQKTSIEEGKQTQYLNQVFFTNGNYLYGISTMTSNKSESKNLANSIKTINCP